MRILLLEDNPADAELIEYELRESLPDFVLKWEETEEGFFKELHESPPDIILSDYDLPRYNGALALADARRLCPDVPFILVTGAVSEDRAIEILTSGAKDYVLKTRLNQRLVPAVQRALAEAEEHRARKLAEAELREAHRTLEERVKRRTAELEAEMVERKRMESRLAADLAALTRMHALSTKLLEADGFKSLLQEIMDTAIAIVAADKGTLQLVEDDSLRIVAHQGHDRPFLDFFSSAENVASVCGAATKKAARVVVEDVETSPLLAGTPSLAVLRNASIRSVQSTPLINRRGKLLGMLTTQWSTPHVPDEHDLWRLDLLARQAADMIEQTQTEEMLRESEGREHERAEELAVMLDSVPTPVIVVHDSEATHMTGNRAANELLRIRHGEISLSAPDDVKPRHLKAMKDGRELRLDELPARRAARGEYVKDFEYNLVFEDGATKELLAYGTPLSDSQGRPRGAVHTLVDITERKRAEERLLANQAELTEAQRLTHIGSWFWDAETDVTTGSDELLRIYGFDPATQAMPNFNEQRGYCYPVEDWEKINAAVQRTMETGIGYELEVKALQNGKIIWITTRGESVRNAENRIIGLRGTVQDITEHKQVEEKRRESEIRLRRVFDSDLLGIFYWNIDGNITGANDKFLNMVGYSREDLETGRVQWAQMTPPEYRHLHEFALAEVKAKGVDTPYEKEYIKKDGTRIPVYIGAATLDEKRVEGVACVLDVTERKRAEETLAADHRQIQNIINNAPAVVYAFDLEERFVMANSALAELLNSTPEQMMGRDATSLCPKRMQTGMRRTIARLLKRPRRWSSRNIASSMVAGRHGSLRSFHFTTHGAGFTQWPEYPLTSLSANRQKRTSRRAKNSSGKAIRNWKVSATPFPMTSRHPCVRSKGFPR